jgi:hypothetical protein
MKFNWNTSKHGLLYVLTKEAGGAGEGTGEEDMVGARDGLSASGEGPTEVVRSSWKSAFA